MGYTKWDHKRIQDIWAEVKTKTVMGYIKHFLETQRSHAGAFPEAILKCLSKEK
jgi:hypothetical protein